MSLHRHASQLNYVNLIEMSGIAGPQSCRQRNMLHATLLLSDLQPTRAISSLFDKTQGIARDGIFHVGTVPTMATNASMWRLLDARVISVQERGHRIGHDMDSARVHGICETHLNNLFGRSLRVGAGGLMLSRRLAALAHAPKATVCADTSVFVYVAHSSCVDRVRLRSCVANRHLV